MNIVDILRDYESTVGGLTFHAPLDIVLSDHDVVQPDLVYFREERRGLIRDWEATRAAPDLAVEVLSRSTQDRDRGRKMELLARFGVPEYWIADPAGNVLEIYVLRSAAYELAVAVGDDAVVSSPTLADSSFTTSRVFAP